MTSITRPVTVIAVSTSISSRNEPGNAGLHNGIKPDPQRDSFVHLPHGVFGKGGDVKVLLQPLANEETPMSLPS